MITSTFFGNAITMRIPLGPLHPWGWSIYRSNFNTLAKTFVPVEDYDRNHDKSLSIA